MNTHLLAALRRLMQQEEPEVRYVAPGERLQLTPQEQRRLQQADQKRRRPPVAVIGVRG